DSGTAVVWDLPAQVVRKRAAATAGAWSPDGRRLALASPKGDVVLYAADDLAEERSFPAGGRARSVAFSPDGRHLAWAAGRNVRCWDYTENRFAGPTREHPDTVQDLAFNDRGDRLATACQDGRGRVFAVPGE